MLRLLLFACTPCRYSVLARFLIFSVKVFSLSAAVGADELVLSLDHVLVSITYVPDPVGC